MRLCEFREMPAAQEVVIKELVLARRLLVVDVWIDRSRPQLRRVLLVFASCPRGARWLYRREGWKDDGPMRVNFPTVSYEKTQAWAEIESAELWTRWQ